MLVHSYLYYEKDVNIVSDSTWSKWAMELVTLQTENPEVSNEVEYSDMFKDWDGSSGVFLTYDKNIQLVANKLYENKDKKLSKPKLSQPKKKSVSKRLF